MRVKGLPPNFVSGIFSSRTFVNFRIEQEPVQWFDVVWKNLKRVEKSPLPYFIPKILPRAVLQPVILVVA
jgi:hypothetical protein